MCCFSIGALLVLICLVGMLFHPFTFFVLMLAVCAATYVAIEGGAS
jgi:hypothetical protein